MRDISRALNERENPSWVWVMSFLWLGPWKEHKRENEKASVAQGSPLPLFSGLLWHVLLSSITASLPGWTEPAETQSWSRSFSSLKPTMSGIWSQRRKATNAARYHCCNAILLSWFNYCPCGHIVAVTYRPLLGPFFVFCPNSSKATYLYCECTHGNLEKHFTLCFIAWKLTSTFNKWQNWNLPKGLTGLYTCSNQQISNCTRTYFNLSFLFMW